MLLRHKPILRMLLAALCALIAGARQSTLAASPPARIAIGSVGFFTYLGRTVDPVYKPKLNAAGYQIGSLEYQDVTDGSVRPYNVLVLQWMPGEGGTHENKVLDSKIAFFQRYVEAGGGLLITCENSYDSYKAMNRLLKGFDAAVVNEGVVDEKNNFRQENFLQYWYTKTTNLDKTSPLMAGFDSFIYPGMYSPNAASGTLPLRVGAEWQPVISGEASAHSSGNTIPSAPVLVASRAYGKGRIVLMGTHTTFFFNSGYHQIWERICMEKGNGAKFLDNCYHWLAAPSIALHNFGGYDEKTAPKKVVKAPTLSPDDVSTTDEIMKVLTAGYRKPVPHVVDEAEHRTDYIGLIGAHTAYSSGQGSVHDFVTRAVAKGYRFIVFTEDLSLMDADKWQKLVADCKTASSKRILAIPGLDYKDTQGNRYFAFNLKKYPNKEWLSPDGKQVKDTPGIYFGEDWAAIYLVNDTQWSKPWQLKFYSGLALVSYPRGATTPVQNFGDYLQLQSNDYNLIPIVERSVYAPADVDKATGFQTHALARDMSDIPRSFRFFWYANRHAYVSSGPCIAEFKADNGWLGAREEEWHLPIAIQDDVPITDVVLYDQKRVFYHWHPGQKSFTRTVRGYHDQQRFLTLVATDAKGRKAYSSTCYTSDVSGQSIKMCTDQQNTLNGAGIIHPDGRIDYINVMGNYNTNWDGLSMGILGGDIMPPGLDYIAGGFGGGVAPTGYGKQGANTDSGVAQRDIVFGSGDVTIMDNYFDTKFGPKGNIPTDVIDSTVRFISFTPRLSSYNMMLLQTAVKFKKDFTFNDQAGPQLRTVSVGGSDKSFKNFTYLDASGQKISGPRDKDIVATLPKGGYVALWPDFYGSLGLYPLQAQQAFNLHGASIDFGQAMPAREVKAGAEIDDSLLVVRDKFGSTSDAGFDHLRTLYGLAGTPAYAVKLTHGKVVSLPLVATLQATTYTVAGHITPAPLPNNLAIKAQGINPNWDAGLYDASNRVLRRIGVFENTGYCTADISHGLNFVAGNLLLASDPTIRLHLFVSNGHEAQIEAHNPTDKAVQVKIWGNPQIPGLASLRATCHLKAGEDQTIVLPLANELRWTQAGLRVGTRRMAAMAAGR